MGIFLTIAGILIFNGYKNEIVDNANHVKDFAIKQIPKDSPLIQVVNDKPVDKTVVQSQPVDSSQQNSQSIEELRQIALDDINYYRTQAGLNSLPLVNAKASQAWADHLLAEGCIAHREGNSGPEQRYLDNGDKLEMIFENVSGGYGTSSMGIADSIKQANSEMMNNDADQNNAHRDNILNPNHNSVSIGISYNSDKLILVEDFQEPMITNWQTWDMSYTDGKSCW